MSTPSFEDDMNRLFLSCKILQEMINICYRYMYSCYGDINITMTSVPWSLSMIPNVYLYTVVGPVLLVAMTSAGRGNITIKV